MIGIQVVDNLVEKVKNKVGLSLNEGMAWAKKLKERNKETRRLQDEKIFNTHFTKTDETMPDQNGQQRYLMYALSFIEKEYPRYSLILQLRMRGLSIRRIAQNLSSTKGVNITVEEVSKQEAAAIRLVKQTIERIKNTGTPIFGDLPAARKDFSDTGDSRPILTGTRRKAPNQGESNVSKIITA